MKKTKEQEEIEFSQVDCLYYKDEKIRKKIDKLLEKNAQIEANLGKSTPKKEYASAKVKQDRLFDQIKSLDSEFYKIICIKGDR